MGQIAYKAVTSDMTVAASLPVGFITEYIPVELIPEGTDMSQYTVTDQASFDALLAQNDGLYAAFQVQWEAQQQAANEAAHAALIATRQNS